MLVSFSAANFRSIKDKQAIDLQLASKIHNTKEIKDLKNNCFATGCDDIPELLKVAAIYGANAAGKSNIIKAVNVFKNVVVGQKRQRGKKIAGYDPFLFDKSSKKNPCEFEIEVILKGGRYLYSFAFDSEKIHYEKLSIYQGKELVTIYEINIESTFKQKFHPTLFKGEKDRSLDEMKNTKNNLFLSLNVNDGNGFLNNIYDWILHKLLIEYINGDKADAVEFLTENVENKKHVLKLLQTFDLGIVDFEMKKTDIPEKYKDAPKPVLDYISADFTEFTFKNHLGYFFRWEQLSNGSKAIFALAPKILPILAKGGVLFFDELDASLHPEVLINIVKMFVDPKINKHNGQLIFTAHNDILLEAEYNLFRRDQIYFVNKNHKELKTKLYSISNFKSKDLKARDNIAKKYRDHHFGARPFLGKFKWQ